MQEYEQPAFVDDLNIELTSESNMISYEQYLQENKSEVVHKRQQIDLNDRENYIDTQLRKVIVDRNEKVADFENQIHSLKQQLRTIVESHKTLSTTVDVLKMESKEKEDKYLDEIIELEKKKKALDNVVYKMGQSTQMMHMLTKPQDFYDKTHKIALGYQHPLYLTQAQRKVPDSYCGHMIVKKHDALSVNDTEETLILAEDSRNKMLEKQNDLIIQEKKVNITPIYYVALNKLSDHFVKHFVPKKYKKSFEIKEKELLFENERLLEHILYQDVMCIALHDDVGSKYVMPVNDICLEYAELEKSCIAEHSKVFELEADLVK
ncbi:hypothetical protein Tco_0862031, partial [Tanacetum coccineum]